MDKKVIGIGAIILVAGIALGFLTPAFLQPPFDYSNFTIGQGAYHYVNFTLPRNSTTTVFFIDANFSSPVNAYLFTKQAFSSWSAGNGTGMSRALALEGTGLITAYTNVTQLVIPTGSNGRMLYSSNQSFNDTSDYDLVFENPSNSSKPVGATMAYIMPTSITNLTSGSKLDSYLTTAGEFEAVFFILMPIVGIGIMIYGAFRKRRGMPKGMAGTAEEIKARDRLYKKVGKNR